MKEMVYKSTTERELLHSGDISGYKFWIISMGTHPCAYVQIPLSNAINHSDIECNGGITYHSDCLYISNTEKVKGNIIGWDYAHCWDFMGYYLDDRYMIDERCKKWTTIEIYKEVESVINQLLRLKKGDN